LPPLDGGRMFYGKCLVCSNRLKDDQIFCSECLKYALHLSRKCSRCGGFSIIDKSSGCNLCNSRKIWFDSLFSPYIYCGTISSVISVMKYGKNSFYASILGSHLASLINYESVKDKTVIFPPMSFIDRFSRSFNQSEIIAEKIASKYKLPLIKNLIVKKRRTKPQASLTYDKRLKNLHGAFEIKKNVNGLSFLIVDDVCTTFSTINTISELLKKNGAKEVSAITIARTSPYFG